MNATPEIERRRRWATIRFSEEWRFTEDQLQACQSVVNGHYRPGRHHFFGPDSVEVDVAVGSADRVARAMAEVLAAP